MSKLQKSAWFNLALGTIISMISAVVVLNLARLNAIGVVYLFVCIFVPVLMSPALYILYRKKSLESHFDEREKMINRRAFTVSAFGLMMFLSCVCFFPFFVLGGQNVIKVYYLPLIFLGTLFIAQFVHSAAILIMCALEGDDGQ